MVYLDNAATSFPKPPEVTREVIRCMTEYCGNPGRGGHPLAMAAADKIYECREALARMFGAPGADYVIFTPNATAALNLAIKGLIPAGTHAVTSDMEHNSVRRPLERLKKDRKSDFSVFASMTADPLRSDSAICSNVERRVRRNTSAVIVTACPNICSVQLPLALIGAFCRRHGYTFIVDGAQGAGHMPINMKEMCIDALAIPGHKGLFGPQGSGALLLGEGVKPETILEGGSGSASFDADMPPEAPERYEAGTLPTPAIAGLLEGVRYVNRLGTDRIAQHERTLFIRARELLSAIDGVRIFAPDFPGSVLSFDVRAVPSDRIAYELGRRGVCVRGGFHCAPWAHGTLGSESGGSVRASFSPFNTSRDVETMAESLRDVLSI